MRSVPIQVYKAGVPEPENTWELGIWGRNSRSIKKEDIWGLAINGWPTQMCYGMDYAEPWECIAERRKKAEEDPDPDWLLWYFDVGRKLYCTLNDIEEALKKLGYEGPENI